MSNHGAIAVTPTTPLPGFPPLTMPTAHRPSSVIAKTGPPASSQLMAAVNRNSPSATVPSYSPQDRPVPAPRWHRRGEFSSSHARSRTPSSGSGKARPGLVETPSSRATRAISGPWPLSTLSTTVPIGSSTVSCVSGAPQRVAVSRVVRPSRSARKPAEQTTSLPEISIRPPGTTVPGSRSHSQLSRARSTEWTKPDGYVGTAPAAGCSHVVVTSRSHTGMTSPASDRVVSHV